MSLNDYQEMAYYAIQEHENDKAEIMHWAVGLGEEAGEVLGVVKHRYFSNDYEPMRMVDELGDALWHISAMAVACGFTLDDIAQYNLLKIRCRYPDGKFDEIRSENRHEVDGANDTEAHREKSNLEDKIVRTAALIGIVRKGDKNE